MFAVARSGSTAEYSSWVADRFDIADVSSDEARTREINGLGGEFGLPALCVSDTCSLSQIEIERPDHVRPSAGGIMGMRRQRILCRQIILPAERFVKSAVPPYILLP